MKNQQNQSGTGFCVHHRIVSALKWAEFVSDRMPYRVLKCRYSVIALNVRALSEKKNYDWKGSFHEELEQVFYHFLQYHMKILLEDFNAKMGRENIFKPTIGDKSLHQDINGNGVSIVNFTTTYSRKYVLYVLSLELVLSKQRNGCLAINCLHYTEDGQNIWTNAENKSPIITFYWNNNCKTELTTTRERRLLSWSAHSFLSFRLLCLPLFSFSFPSFLYLTHSAFCDFGLLSVFVSPFY